MGKATENSHTGIVLVGGSRSFLGNGVGPCEMNTNDDSRETSPAPSTHCQDRTVLAGQEKKIYLTATLLSVLVYR